MPREGTADVSLSSDGVSTPPLNHTAQGAVGAIRKYRKTSFFSTRKMSKGGDNRARARGT